VIWHSREQTFRDGYAICEREHPGVRFIAEDALTYQVSSLLRGNEMVSFFTDDDVLYGRVEELDLHDEVICFSLRLGRNTTYCYPHAREQKLPITTAWEWKGADGDFGYPMSLDGHIFRSEDLLSILKERHFSTPNWLEVILMKSASEIGRPWMACYPESRLVGIPANRVNTDMPNRNGETYPFGVHDLNVLYLRGRRINLDALDFSDIRGAHQEIELRFT
jgi:hypothetical protein